ncbi:DBH-like monooxygenase protein 1 [Lineus longissimus]|uniref:DBH-like monooxygenase protein 1 n=1 Tax=Lineus longissimus TaxID=88925 RepID=UPI002B4E8781
MRQLLSIILSNVILSELFLLSLCYTDVCPAVEEPDTKYFDLRLPETRIPAKSTFYVCKQFELPEVEDDYHAVAFEPIINNTGILHHMLLFSCSDDSVETQPHECGSYDNQQCGSWLTVWTIGLKERQICTYPDTGVKFGKNSIKYMSLQIHWHNDKLRENLVDTSGIRIFYTKRLRKYDVGNVQIGQNNLVIPPGGDAYAQSGSCMPECTRDILQHPIYLTRTALHMHFTGIRAMLSQYRKGRLVREIAYDPKYNYEAPPIHYHDPPARILPGDEVRMTCWFDTKNGERKRNGTVYFGEGALDEMCYAFVSYFPRLEHFDQCIQFDEFNSCKATGNIGSCETDVFADKADIELFPAIDKACREDVCGEECMERVHSLMSEDCMKGNIGGYIRRNIISHLSLGEEIEGFIAKQKTCSRGA